MDKYMKTRFMYILKNKTGPNDEKRATNAVDNNATIDEMRGNDY